MGVFDALGGRDGTGRLSRSIISPQTITEAESKHFETNASFANNTDDIILEDSNQATNNLNSSSTNGHGIADNDPDHVTNEAALGQQKAEAAALVWSRPVVFLIYAW